MDTVAGEMTARHPAPRGPGRSGAARAQLPSGSANSGSANSGLATQFRPILLRLDLLVRRQNTQYALSRAQTSILHTLASHGRLRMSDLARLENVRVPTTSNSVNVVEGMGYVERVRDESDGRGVCVQLTDLGRTRIDQVLEERDQDFAAHLSMLSSEHRESLSAAVPALNALLDAIDSTATPH